jgi:transcriptional regulator with XRE-family HTH domain
MRPKPKLEKLKHLGEAIERIRSSLGMTQRELSAKSGVSQSTISEAESNLKHIGVNTLESLATALNLRPSQLLALVEDYPKLRTGEFQDLLESMTASSQVKPEL